MPIQDHKSEIENLERELLTLKERKAEAFTKSDEWVEKRDKLNAQANDARSKIHRLKVKRDSLNQKVKELKLLRDNTTDDIRQTQGELRTLRQKAKALADRRPRRHVEVLQKELNQVEWSIQTESLSLQQEKERVDCVRQLQAQIDIHKKIGKNRQEMLELQTKFKAAHARRTSHHNELTTVADRSQEFHEQISQTIEELKELQVEATKAHDSFLQARDRVNALQEQILSTIARIRLLRKEIREREELAKCKKQDAIRKKAKKEAKTKLNSGEKLTWQEFQMTTDEEETT